MATEIPFQIDRTQTRALVAAPKGPIRGGVALTFHREGLEAFTHLELDRLADAGFAAIAPDHFHVLPAGVGYEGRKPFMKDEQMARDLEVAAHWLAEHGGVSGGRLAVMGPCMGGRTTLVALAAHPELWKCGCIWYGGSSFNASSSVWPAPADVDRLKKIRAPIAGFFGNLDTHPSPDEVDELDARLTALGKEHVFYRYDGADHGFLNSLHPKTYAADAAAHSWSTAMTFIDEHLNA